MKTQEMITKQGSCKQKSGFLVHKPNLARVKLCSKADKGAGMETDLCMSVGDVSLRGFGGLLRLIHKLDSSACSTCLFVIY